jgi:hypothetical protein
MTTAVAPACGLHVLAVEVHVDNATIHLQWAADDDTSPLSAYAPAPPCTCREAADIMFIINRLVADKM